jgi:lactoylglutathione lyase
MIPIRDLFESHLTVSNLERSMAFYGSVLGLEVARFDAELKAAFYWIGERGDSMLGLWEAGATPLRTNLHLAFRADLAHVLDAPRRLRMLTSSRLISPAIKPRGSRAGMDAGCVRLFS